MRSHSLVSFWQAFDIDFVGCAPVIAKSAASACDADASGDCRSSSRRCCRLSRRTPPFRRQAGGEAASVCHAAARPAAAATHSRAATRRRPRRKTSGLRCPPMPCAQHARTQPVQLQCRSLPVQLQCRSLPVQPDCEQPQRGRYRCGHPHFERRQGSNLR
eukprot:6165299-Pleurochrysis_carterae.AAC.1